MIDDPSQQNCVRIVPRKNSDGSPCTLTQGTMVLMPDGTPMPRVSRIVLEAGLNTTWVAHITVHSPQIDGEILALNHMERPPTTQSVGSEPISFFGFVKECGWLPLVLALLFGLALAVDRGLL